MKMDIELVVKQLREKHGKSLLNKREVAEELGISVASIDRLRTSAAIKSKKVLGLVQFRLLDVAEFIVEQ